MTSCNDTRQQSCAKDYVTERQSVTDVVFGQAHATGRRVPFLPRRRFDACPTRALAIVRCVLVSMISRTCSTSRMAPCARRARLLKCARS